MAQLDREKFSPQAIVLGVLSFVVVTLLMLAVIEIIGIERIRQYMERAGPLAPLAYIGIKIATYVIAPLSSGPIQLSAGLLFGLIPGTLYTLLGEVLGGSISFLIARRLGRPVVKYFVGSEGIQRVDQFTQQLGGWRALLYARLFLFSIYDFISYAAGLTRTIRLREYIIVSTVAGFIPTFLAVAVGATLAEDRRMIFVLYAVIGIISLVPLVVRFFRQRRRHHPPPPPESA